METSIQPTVLAVSLLARLACEKDRLDRRKNIQAWHIVCREKKVGALATPFFDIAKAPRHLPEIFLVSLPDPVLNTRCSVEETGIERFLNIGDLREYLATDWNAVDRRPAEADDLADAVVDDLVYHAVGIDHGLDDLAACSSDRFTDSVHSLDFGIGWTLRPAMGRRLRLGLAPGRHGQALIQR